MNQRKHSKLWILINTISIIIVLISVLGYGAYRYVLNKYEGYEFLRYAKRFHEKGEDFKAFVCAKLALKKKDEDASNFLAYYYFEKNDFEEALYWAEQFSINNKHLMAALIAEKEKDYDKALSHYQKILNDSVPALYENFKINLYGKFLKPETCRHYKKLAEQGNSLAMLLIGISASYIQNEEGEIYWYEKYLETQKSDFVAKRLARIFYGRKKDKLKALKYYEQFVTEKSDEYDIYDLARIYVEKKQYDNAIKWYKIAIRNGHKLGADYLTDLYESMHKYEEAIKVYKENNNENNLIALARLGELYLNLNKKVKAKECFDKVKKSSDIDALYFLGYYCKNSKDYDQAIICFKKAIDLGDFDSMESLATIYNIQGKTEQAAKLYIRMAIEGENKLIYSKAGNLYTDPKDIAKAVKFYKKAFNGEGHKGLINVIKFYHLQKMTAQEKELKQYILKTYSGFAISALGKMYHKLGADAEAIECFKFLVDDKQTKYRVNLGKSYYNNKQYKKALEQFEAILHTEESLKLAKYLSFTASKLNNYELVKKYYKFGIKAINSNKCSNFYDENLCDILIILIKTAQKQNKLSDSIETIKNDLNNSSKKDRFYKTIALAYASELNKDIPKKEKWIKLLLKDFHERIYLYQIGLFYSSANNYKEAIKWQKKALDAFEQDKGEKLLKEKNTYLIFLGSDYENLKNFKQAAKYYEMAKTTTRTKALVYCGNFFTKQKQPQKAKEFYSLALNSYLKQYKKNDDYESKETIQKVYFAIGRLYEKLGQYEKAKKWYIVDIPAYCAEDAAHELRMLKAKINSQNRKKK